MQLLPRRRLFSATVSATRPASSSASDGIDGLRAPLNIDTLLDLLPAAKKSPETTEINFNSLEFFNNSLSLSSADLCESMKGSFFRLERKRAEKKVHPTPIAGMVKGKADIDRDMRRFQDSVFRLDKLLSTRTSLASVTFSDEPANANELENQEQVTAESLEPSTSIKSRSARRNFLCESISTVMQRGCLIPTHRVREMEIEVRSALREKKEDERTSSDASLTSPWFTMDSAKYQKPTYKLITRARNRTIESKALFTCNPQHQLSENVSKDVHENTTAVQSDLEVTAPVPHENGKQIGNEESCLFDTKTSTSELQHAKPKETSDSVLVARPRRPAGLLVPRLLFIDYRSLTLLHSYERRYILSLKLLADTQNFRTLSEYCSKILNQVLDAVPEDEELSKYFDFSYIGEELPRNQLASLLTAGPKFSNFPPETGPWTREEDDALLGFLHVLTKRRQHLLQCLNAWLKDCNLPLIRKENESQSSSFWLRIQHEMVGAGYNRLWSACKRRWVELLRSGLN